MTSTHRLLRAALATFLLMVAGQANAQDQDYRISQRATLSQTLGSTVISLDYSRPLIRGRSDIFGKVVHWGELWTPGANEASVLEVSHEVKLNGHAVAPGRWSMWIIPSQVGPWELVLDRRDSLFHTQRPELTEDQVRFVVQTKHDAPHMEALAWTFPRVAQDGATLVMNWGSLEIPIEVAVQSIEPPSTVAADVAARYTGTWRIEFVPEEGQPAMPPNTVTLHYGDDGRLHATFAPFPMPPGAAPPAPSPEEEARMTPQERERAHARRVLAEFEMSEWKYVLVPRAEDVFVMGYVEDDVLLDAGYVFHEFEVQNGKAVSITLRDDRDRIWGKGVRDAK